MVKTSTDAYFLQSTDFPNHFIKSEGEDKDGNGVYRLLEGAKGAAIFKYKNARNFIKMCELNNVEPVHVSLILKQ